MLPFEPDRILLTLANAMRRLSNEGDCEFTKEQTQMVINKLSEVSAIFVREWERHLHDLSDGVYAKTPELQTTLVETNRLRRKHGQV